MFPVRSIHISVVASFLNVQKKVLFQFHVLLVRKAGNKKTIVKLSKVGKRSSFLFAGNIPKCSNIHVEEH